MSWSITVTGNADGIGKEFDAERDRSRANGMIEPELLDIQEVRELAMQFAENYGRVAVSASGHWNTISTDAGKVDPERSKFGRISLTIDAAPEAT